MRPDARRDGDPSLCPVCGREGCDVHLPADSDPPPHPADPLTFRMRGTNPMPPSPARGFPASDLDDATEVAREGREIAERGVPYLVDGLIPNYGMAGFLVAYAKVGKTTLGQGLAADLAHGRPFLERTTTAAKVLLLAAEDPPEYTAWLARNLDVPPGTIVFRRKPLILGASELEHIDATVRTRGIGLVLISSWQAVIRGLVKDENDNAGAVQVVERVKAAARSTGIPWLIDAHSGKAEDQGDDADPSRAMRGASAAAGAADFTLSLRYANGTFGTQRRLSGKGRFVSCAPILVELDPSTGRYSVVADPKRVTTESTWRLITEVGALTDTPRTANEIAQACGLVGTSGRPTSAQWRQITEALKGRPEVGRVDEVRRGQKTTCYRRLSGNEV